MNAAFHDAAGNEETPCWTEGTERLWAKRRSAQERERVLQEIPLRRHAEVVDVAAAVAFLDSVDAAFVTGVRLDLNGSQGLDNLQITAHLGLAEKTVRNRLSSLYAKLGVEGRAMAVVKARALDL